MDVAFWTADGPNTAAVLLRGFNESGRANLKIVDADGNALGSFPVVADVRDGGGHVELFLERQPDSGPFDYDSTHRTVGVHY